MIEEVRLPEISENVNSGDVIQVLVKAGDFIKIDQSIVELETEKATFEVPSPVSGKVTEVNLKPGQKVNVGDVIIKVDTAAKADKPTPLPEKVATPQAVEQAEKKMVEKPHPPIAATVPVAPAVRHLANELGVDISKVRGTGPEGKITENDIKQYTRQIITGAPVSPQVTAAMPLPDFAKWGSVERQPLSITRKKIAETLSYAWRNMPHVTHHDQANITTLEEFRKEYTPKVEQAGGKLTITSILLKVVAEALKNFPKFNASFDAATGEIIYKKYCHISVAVDTDRGLLVPVIRDADKKNILQLAVELTQLSAKTRAHKVLPDEMVGGNFTISNLGGIGGTDFSPIIYWPQVAILGVSRTAYKPVYLNNQFQPRLILPLSLSYDHRVIDGAEAARFLAWAVHALEEPYLLIMQEHSA